MKIHRIRRCALMALLLASLFVLGGCGREVSAPTPDPRPKLEIDPNAGALITPSPAPVEPGVAIPGWGSMTIPAGVTEA